MLGENSAENIRAKPSRGKGGNENIRVEKDLQEISRNTSSSVR